MAIIDLHMHTTCSDGVLTPRQVIDRAVKNKVQIISITDHDTTAAYTESTIEYAAARGVQLITGVEISTKIERCGIHVLGYGCDLNSQSLQQDLMRIRQARHDYLHRVSQRLKQLGYQMNLSNLQTNEFI